MLASAGDLFQVPSMLPKALLRRSCSRNLSCDLQVIAGSSLNPKGRAPKRQGNWGYGGGSISRAMWRGVGLDHAHNPHRELTFAGLLPLSASPPGSTSFSYRYGRFAIARQTPMSATEHAATDTSAPIETKVCNSAALRLRLSSQIYARIVDFRRLETLPHSLRCPL